MDILQALLSLPPSFRGPGVNHEGESFTGTLALQPLVGGAAVMLHYSAALPDGRIVHTEATLLGRSTEGKLCLWPVMAELPAVLPHFEIDLALPGDHLAAATFASGPREAAGMFREEITICLGHDGRLAYAHSWGLPQGSFAERSSCVMLPFQGK